MQTNDILPTVHVLLADLAHGRLTPRECWRRLRATEHEFRAALRPAREYTTEQRLLIGDLRRAQGAIELRHHEASRIPGPHADDERVSQPWTAALAITAFHGFEDKRGAAICAVANLALTDGPWLDARVELSEDGDELALNLIRELNPERE